MEMKGGRKTIVALGFLGVCLGLAMFGIDCLIRYLR